MNAHFIWVTAFLTAGCASPVSNGDQSPDAVPEAALKGRCFAVIPAGQPVSGRRQAAIFHAPEHGKHARVLIPA